MCYYVCVSELSWTRGAGIGSGAGLAVGVAPPSRTAPGSLEAVPVPFGCGAGTESGEGLGPLRDGFSVNVRCLDDRQVRVTGIVLFDGQHWEQAFAAAQGLPGVRVAVVP